MVGRCSGRGKGAECGWGSPGVAPGSRAQPHTSRRALQSRNLPVSGVKSLLWLFIGAMGSGLKYTSS